MRAPTRSYALFVLCTALAVRGAYAQVVTVQGYWREPRGAVILISPCGSRLCVEIVRLSGGNHPARDTHNPDPKLRNRPLCGLRIGQGFRAADPRHASGGRLYDPRNGSTYSGEMMAEGNLLHLRGYLGLRILGRTQTWVRAAKPPPC